MKDFNASMSNDVFHKLIAMHERLNVFDVDTGEMLLYICPKGIVGLIDYLDALDIYVINADGDTLTLYVKQADK